MRVLVTGTAGFIGFHTAQALLARGDEVAGVDCVNDYYDVQLKRARLQQLEPHSGFSDHRVDVADFAALQDVFARFRPQKVIHLAAQAGVRYSVENPHVYAQSNLVGFVNVLECCRHGGVEHLTYASTSSVYGANGLMPFQEQHGVGHQVSLYAATKRANEVMAHTYSHLYGVPTTGLRFFTVYGPWGRPDMALFKFTRAILAGEPIDVYNGGDMKRDFTYISDIVEGVIRTHDQTAQTDRQWHANTAHPLPDRSGIGPFRLYNIGCGQPVMLMDFIRTLEEALGCQAKLNMLPMQAGDVSATFADTTALEQAVGYRPQVTVKEGVRAFVDWYQGYYR